MSLSDGCIKEGHTGRTGLQTGSDGLSDQVILLNELSTRLDEYFAMRNLGIDTKGG